MGESGGGEGRTPVLSSQLPKKALLRPRPPVAWQAERTQLRPGRLSAHGSPRARWLPRFQMALKNSKRKNIPRYMKMIRNSNFRVHCFLGFFFFPTRNLQTCVLCLQAGLAEQARSSARPLTGQSRGRHGLGHSVSVPRLHLFPDWVGNV